MLLKFNFRDGKQEAVYLNAHHVVQVQQDISSERDDDPRTFIAVQHENYDSVIVQGRAEDVAEFIAAAQAGILPMPEEGIIREFVVKTEGPSGPDLEGVNLGQDGA